jgi:hypothetical protein
VTGAAYLTSVVVGPKLLKDCSLFFTSLMGLFIITGALPAGVFLFSLGGVSPKTPGKALKI